jgi:hypothetical protein
MATVTPTYSWPVPTSTDYVADGAVAIEALGDAIDATVGTALGGAYPGLRLIKKQTIGSAVTSVTVTGAFSATYEHYKIIVSGGTSSIAGIGVLFSLNNASTNYSYVGTAQQYGNSAVIPLVGGPASSWNDVGRTGTSGHNMNVDLFNPFTTTPTIFRSYTADLNNPGFLLNTGGIQTTSVSHTGFTITPNLGANITGGTIYVYGYGAS